MELTAVELAAGIALADLIVRAGLATSKNEARRAIVGRGVRLDGEIVEDGNYIVVAISVPSRLSLGRKRHVVIALGSN